MISRKTRSWSVQLLLVITATVTLVQCEFNLLLLHTNDMHARFEETNAHSGQCVRGRGKCYGGFARLKTAVDTSKTRAEAEGYSSIFLNAGDTYQGTVLYTMFKWKIVSELANKLGIDVMSLGNHEFDDGPQGLAPFLENSLVPVVCSNIDFSKEPVMADNSNITKLAQSHVLDVDGVKVGVVGYLTPETKFLSNIGNVELSDEIQAIRKEVARLKEEGVKILIALGHSGHKTDKLIAEQVPDLDVVVGGHTNTFLYTGKSPDIEKPEGPYPTVVKQSSGREVLVVQAYAYTKYLGHLKLTFNDEGEVIKREGNPILVDESFKKDGELERAVLKYANEVKEKAGMKIGTSKTFLEADQTCRIRECNFGNLVSDAMVHMNAKDFLDPKGKGWTDAPIAFLQGGALRTSISNDFSGGDIKYSDLLTAMPFLNSVERLVITGDVLYKVLEHSVQRYDLQERPGAFMQFSGIKVEYDLSKPSGQRVVSAKVRCGDCSVPQYLPLDHSKHYNILTNTFLADGGDGYSMLKEALDRKTLSFTDVDAVQNYLAKSSPVHPEIQGRITFVESQRPSPNSATSISHGIFTSLLCVSALKLITTLLLER